MIESMGLTLVNQRTLALPLDLTNIRKRAMNRLIRCGSCDFRGRIQRGFDRHALASRALLDMLRQSGEFGGDPSAFSKANRSLSLAKLDGIIHNAKRDLRK
jgi:hypothetical protein